MLRLVVDAANVVGSRPDGWWRDRAGAADRLLARIAALPATAIAEGLGAPGAAEVVVVLEGPARAAADPGAAVRVVRADRDGDATIAALTAELAAAGDPVVVVTADRGLRARVHAAGGRTTGPSTLLRLLDAGGGPLA